MPFRQFLFDYCENVVVGALLGLLRARDDVGRIGRHGELFLDAGDDRGASDLDGFPSDG